MVTVADQQERGLQYVQVLSTALAQPWCVGAHWFQYIDEPITGRGDGENYNIGLVSVGDVPYPELVNQAKEVNANIYKIRNDAVAHPNFIGRAAGQPGGDACGRANQC